MDAYGANNLLEELNGLANEGEHPAVREILSNIILLSTPNHPGQAEFIKTPETFVQKRSETFIHIVQNMHLLSEEEKTHVRDFIRGAYFYGDEIQNTGRKREITKRVLDEILKTIGLPKLLEAMHFFDSMDSFDSYIERNMFANHVRESYKKLQQEQRTSATVVAIDEDTKGELEFRLTTYFMRANSAENEEQRKFYGTLWALADSKLNPQKYKLTQAEINAAPSGLIQNLEKTRPSFSGQSLVDAGSFIRGVLLPSERANPHYVVNHQTYDML
jgi:hypothetical protein